MPYLQPSRSGAQPPTQRVTTAEVRGVRFGKPPFGKRGYDETEVDEFLRRVGDTLARVPGGTPLGPKDVHEVAFRKPRLGSRGYDEDEVDAFLDLVEAELRWRVTPEGQHELAVQAAQAAQGAQGAAANRVRAVAVAVLYDRGRMLATEHPDPETGRIVYRPPGADVAFGERGNETVVRAFREEFGAGLVDVRPLATLESIHRFGGREGHELVLVYEAAPADPVIWAQPRLIGRRGGVATSAVWVPIEAFRRGEAPLLPDGLVDLLGALSGA
jgi:DivIVA domain-containing protein